MAPAFFNEYKARQDYYDQWIKAQSDELPDDPNERHRLIIKLRQDAYEKLCDAVYAEKGYTPEGIPFPEILERFDLLDEKAANLLTQFGLIKGKKRLSN